MSLLAARQLCPVFAVLAWTAFSAARRTLASSRTMKGSEPPSSNTSFLIRFPASEPIKHQVYLMDDRTAIDPPENIPGQFGNIGFRMTGWEKLARGTHHLTYRAMLVSDVTVQQGLRLLEEAPPFY